MNNKLRHFGLLFFDLLCIGVLWIGWDKVQEILIAINHQVDIIRFSNRTGFFIVGIGFPLLHLFMMIEQLRPDFIKKISKYKALINNCVMGFIVALVIAGFVVSSWLESRAEDAGYVYCWYVSDPSALAKTLVYTKDAKLCEDLSAKARAERTRR
jgi:hypothetical protein